MAAKKGVARQPATPVRVRPPGDAETQRSDRRRLAVILARVLAVAGVLAAALFLLLERDDPPTAAALPPPVVLSADALRSFAAERNAAVYWGGNEPLRRLELSTTSGGTFLRYLPPGADVGDSRSLLTVATYPLADAWATAKARATGPRMTSRRRPDGGIAVWSRDTPTSVYVAWSGVPYLVEVYAPYAQAARPLALSGRLRRVS